MPRGLKSTHSARVARARDCTLLCLVLGTFACGRISEKPHAMEGSTKDATTKVGTVLVLDGGGLGVAGESAGAGSGLSAGSSGAAGLEGRVSAATARAGTGTEAPTAAVSGAGGFGNGPIAGAGEPAPANVSAAPNAWLMMGYDQRNWYFNPAEKSLSVDNASQLVELWRTKLSVMPTGSPVIVDGKVFTMASQGTYALELETGKRLWSREDLGGAASIAYEDGFIYVHTMAPAALYKLKAVDGSTVWGPSKPFDPDNALGESSPILAAGLVIVGHDNGAREVLDSATSDARGGVEAYDTLTGKNVWTYYTVPEQGENGASVWSSVAVDLASQTVYAATGNNFTVTGPNSDAIHALDLMTGQRRWLKQVRANDLSYTNTLQHDQDTDFGANPILVELEGRRIVASGDKSGTFWALDRQTGEILWSRTQLSPTTMADQHGGIFINGAFDGRYFYVVSNTESPGGVLHKLDALDKGTSVWTHKFDQLTWGALSLANGLLLAPVNTKLYVMNAATGAVLNQFETGGTIAGGAAAVAEGKIVVKSGLIYVDATNMSNDEIVCYGLPRKSAAPTGAAGASGPASLPSAASSFSAVYRDIIASTGCASGQCHAGATTSSLDLKSKDIAYASLVGVAAMGMSSMGMSSTRASCAASGLLRVAPRDPDHSLLVMKLEHTQPCGAPMPTPSMMLPAQQLQQVRAWIANGAAND